MPRPLGTAGKNQVPGLLRAYRLCAFGLEGEKWNRVTRALVGCAQELRDRDPMEFMRRWHEAEMRWMLILAKKKQPVKVVEKMVKPEPVEPEEDFSWTGGREPEGDANAASF